MTTYAEQEVVKSYLIAKGLAAKARMQSAQVAQDFMEKDSTRILGYLEEDLNKTFQAEDVAEFQLSYTNIIPKIVRKLALLKKAPASISIPDHDSETEAINKLLRGVGYHQFMTEVHQAATLHNTVMPGAVPDPTNEYGVRLVLLRPSVTYVQPKQNWYEAEWLKYPTIRRVDFREQIVWEYWSDEEHKYLQDNGAVVTGEGVKDPMKGHPGENPFIPYRLEQHNDFWGEGMSDLVNANRILNFVLTAGLVENIIMAGFGQLLGVNLNLESLRLGPKHPVLVDDVGVDDKEPKLESIDLSTHADEIQGFVDWFHKLNGTLQGLPASSFASAEVAMSGYAKMLDSMELLERRESEIPVIEPQERRFLRKILTVANKKRQVLDPKWADDLDIEYAPVTFPEMHKEKAEKWESRIRNKIATPVDWIMDIHKGMTRDEAKEHYTMIQEEAAELRMTLGNEEVPPFQPGDSGNGDNEEDQE